MACTADYGQVKYRTKMFQFSEMLQYHSSIFKHQFTAHCQHQFYYPYLDSDATKHTMKLQTRTTETTTEITTEMKTETMTEMLLPDQDVMVRYSIFNPITTPWSCNGRSCNYREGDETAVHYISMCQTIYLPYKYLNKYVT